MSAQLVHAAGESVSSRLSTGTHAIVLGIESESQLRTLANKLEQLKIPHKLIVEVDAPYTGQATAIGIEPTCDRKKIRRLISNLPLFGKKKELRRRGILDICSQFIADLWHHMS